MKLSDNKEKTVSIRMSLSDYKLLYYASWHLNLTVSKYIRMLADSTLQPLKVKLKKGQLTNEDIETVFDNNL